MYTNILSGIIKNNIAKRLDADVEPAVVDVEIRGVVGGGGFRVFTLWHAADVEEKGRSFGAVVRKIFGPGGPVALDYIFSSGGLFKRRQRLFDQIGRVVGDECLGVD